MSPSSSSSFSPRTSSPPSSSTSTALSRLVCIRNPLFSSFALYLFPFVGYRFLFQSRLFELGYHVLLAAAAAYILVWGWHMPLLLRITALWLCVRTLLTIGLHATYRSLHKYYQQPPRTLRIVRQAVRALSCVLVFVSLVVSSRSVHATELPDEPVVAMWCLLVGELCVAMCALLAYGLLHLVFRNNELSTLFPFIQPSAYAFGPFSSATSAVSPGLSTADLGRLPCYEWRAGLIASLAEDGCVICQSGVSEGESVRQLRCGHGFHRHCVDRWLQRRSVCPLCVRVVRVDGEAVGEGPQQVELVVAQSSET